MALDSLLATMERRAAATPDTPCNPVKVSAKPAPILACTPDTRDTPRNDNAGSAATVPNPASGDVAALREAANDEPLPDPAAEARRQRVLAKLAANPAKRLAVVCDGEGDPVPVAVAIRDKGTCEVHIPRAKYDGALLLDLIERHIGTVH